MKFSSTILLVFLCQLLSGQGELAGETQLIVVVNEVMIIPETKYNYRKFSDVAQRIRSEIKSSVTASGYHLIPDLDAGGDSKKWEQESLLTVSPSLYTPDNSLGITDFELELNLVNGELENQISELYRFSLGPDLKNLKDSITVNVSRLFKQRSQATGSLMDKSGKVDNIEVRKGENYNLFIFDPTQYMISFYSDSQADYGKKYMDCVDEKPEECEKAWRDLRKQSREINGSFPVVNKVRLAEESIFWYSKYKNRIRHLKINHSKRYNILIFPFDKIDDCNGDLSLVCTKVVRNMLYELGEDKNVMLDVRISDQFNTPYSPLDFETARKIGEESGADLLMWGDYENKCAWDSTLLNVKFLPVNEKMVNPLIGEKRQTGFKKVDAISEMLSMQYFTGDINDIVYYSLGKSESDCEKKEYFYQKLNTVDSEYLPALLDLIQCNTYQSNYARAKELINEAKLIDSTDARLYRMESVFYGRQNNYQKAIDLEFKVLEAGGKINVFGVCEYYIKLREYDKAITFIEKYDTNLSGYHYLVMGILHDYNKQYEKSVNAYKKAVSLYEHGRNDTYIKLARAYERTDKPGEALKTLNVIVNHLQEKRIITDAKPFENRALLNLKYFKDTAAAIVDYTTLIEKGFVPAKMIGFRNRYRLYKKQGKYEEALRDLEQYINGKTSNEKNRSFIHSKDKYVLLYKTRGDEAADAYLESVEHETYACQLYQAKAILLFNDNRISELTQLTEFAKNLTCFGGRLERQLDAIKLFTTILEEDFVMNVSDMAKLINSNNEDEGQPVNDSIGFEAIFLITETVFSENLELTPSQENKLWDELEFFFINVNYRDEFYKEYIYEHWVRDKSYAITDRGQNLSYDLFSPELFQPVDSTAKSKSASERVLREYVLVLFRNRQYEEAHRELNKLLYDVVRNRTDYAEVIRFIDYVNTNTGYERNIQGEKIRKSLQWYKDLALLKFSGI